MDELFGPLAAVLEQFEDSAPLQEPLVRAAWRKIAGDLLNEQTAPLEFAEKRLVVAVTGEQWKGHLEDLSGQMIFKLNALFGSPVVRYIEFRVDETAVRSAHEIRNEPSEARFAAEAAAELGRDVRDASAAIHDDELRARFLGAAGSCLLRRKHLKER